METPTPSTRPDTSNARTRLPRRLAVLGLAGGLALGGAGAVLIPAVASAASSATGTAGSGVSWIQNVLAPLVSNGTISQAQADAVGSALDAARPAGPPAGGRRGGPGLDAAASALGITGDQLRDRLQGGQTIAQVASANGVGVQTVIDAMVAAESSALDQAVTDGKLTQAQADARKADAAAHATAIVNGQRPARPGPRPGAPADTAPAS